jgi:subtilisin family serine protease
MRVFNQLDMGRSPEAPGEYTGRYLVILREDATEEGTEALRSAGGLNVHSTADVESGVLAQETVQEADAVVFHNLGVALVDAPTNGIESVTSAAATNPAILAMEPERVCQAIQTGPIAVRSGSVSWDESEVTWGIQATRADCSSADGTGIDVAVLDTGLFVDHPDFAGRTVQTESFITGETADDVAGHGTHCVGTACGPQTPQILPRYGVAHGANIFMGKVLNNQGRGGDGGILAGIDWAVGHGCHVISMSLGARVGPGSGFSAVFELAARRALTAGSLIVAAAGNDSQRPLLTTPVSHPANCPSILAVGALDPQLLPAAFSNAGVNPQGGEVDIAGPGVDVRSTWPAPLMYRTISGTSMATPHVAGIAALIAQTTGLSGAGLWQALTAGARNVGLPRADAGAGLAQAPR